MTALPAADAILQSGSEIAMQGLIVAGTLVGIVLFAALVYRLVSGEFAPPKIRQQFRSGYRSAENGDDATE